MAKAEDKTILIVDDEPDTVTFLETTLKYAGFQVMTASNGEEAIERVREKKPDFISLDLVMPRKSGIKFFYELRKDKELSRIPVMIVTGHARDELGSGDLNTLLEDKMISGPQAYLEKPVTPERYVAAIKRALGIEDEEADEAGVDRNALRRELDSYLNSAGDDQLKKLKDLLSR
jgi:two-component system alkaline phosphatase synthesis response regulator PhoP